MFGTHPIRISFPQMSFSSSSSKNPRSSFGAARVQHLRATVNPLEFPTLGGGSKSTTPSEPPVRRPSNLGMSYSERIKQTAAADEAEKERKRQSDAETEAKRLIELRDQRVRSQIAATRTLSSLYTKTEADYEEPYPNYGEDNHAEDDLDYDAPYNGVSRRSRGRVADYSEDIPEYDEEYPAEGDE